MLSKPKILVATDFTPNSDLAVKFGKRIQELTKGEMTLIHVSGAPTMWSWLTDEIERTFLPEEFHKGFFSALSLEMNNQMKRCEVSCGNNIIFGDPYKDLSQLMDKMSPDLLIMGHRGDSGPFQIGSLSQKIIASSNIPVMVINEDRPVKKIAGLIDPASPSEKVMTASEEISFLLSTDLEFISLIPDISIFSTGHLTQLGAELSFSEEEKKLMISKINGEIIKRLAPNSNASVKVEVTKKKIHDGLNDLLTEDKTDMVVIARHNKNRLEKIFIGSVSRRMLERFPGNLLVIPELENE